MALMLDFLRLYCVNLLLLELLLLAQARRGQGAGLRPPLQHSWRPGTTAAGVPEVTFVLQPATV